MWSSWPSPLLFPENLHASNVLLVVGTLVFGYAVLTRQLARAKLRHFPTPLSTLPVLGNTLDLIRTHRDRIHDWFLAESLRHNGTPWLLSSVGRPNCLVLTKESHFEDVLKTHFAHFEKGPQTRELVQDFFGVNGIFALDGDAWRHQRKTASHLFSHQMIRESMAQAIVDDTRVVLRMLRDAHDTHTQIEIKLLMDALTTDVFTKIGFGVRLGCLQDPLKQAQDGETVSPFSHEFGPDFHRAFSRCPMAIQARAQQPGFLWKIKRWLQIGSEKQLRVDMARINGAVYKVIQASMDRFANRDPAQRSTSKDLISLFLTKQQQQPTSGDSGGQAQDQGLDQLDQDPAKMAQLIRDMALNFIAAGRGTTGQSLAWFFVMMARYPDVHRKIMDELQRELPQLLDGDRGGDAVPTMEEATKLTYLEAAIRESLRLNPAAPMNARMAMQDTVLSDGTFIPKGVRVIIPTYATARLPWIWGEDAAEFRPERWIDTDTNQLKPIAPFKFLVFHAGPRICLGAKLAVLEMKISIAAVLSKFEFELERDPMEIQYRPSLSLPIKGDLFARVRPVVLSGKAAMASVAERHDTTPKVVATVA